MNLEDRFLKQNIQGQVSTWRDSLSSDDRSDNHDDDGEDSFNSSTIIQSSSIQSATNHDGSHSFPFGHNTGVKGVIRDQKIHQAMEQQKKYHLQQQREATLHRIAYGCTVTTEARVNGLSRRRSLEDSEVDGKDDDDGDEFDDSDSGEILKRYRQQRYQEMQQTKTIFGYVQEVSPEEYSKAVDDMLLPNSDSLSTTMVVILYDNDTLHTKFDEILDQLASKHLIHVQFLKINLTHSDSSNNTCNNTCNIDSIVLPAVLIYKQGQILHNIVRFLDGLPQGFSLHDIQEYLRRHDVY